MLPVRQMMSRRRTSNEDTPSPRSSLPAFDPCSLIRPILVQARPSLYALRFREGVSAYQRRYRATASRADRYRTYPPPESPSGYSSYPPCLLALPRAAGVPLPPFAIAVVRPTLLSGTILVLRRGMSVTAYDYARQSVGRTTAIRLPPFAFAVVGQPSYPPCPLLCRVRRHSCRA